MTHEICLKSEDLGGDFFILTRKRGTGPFSFSDREKTVFQDNRPPPVYLRLDDLNKPKKFDKETCLADFKITANGELQVTDQEVTERQKGVISDLIRNLTTKFLEGKNLVGVSLPVRIFEPRT